MCRLAGALRSLGVGRGDVVALYLPNLPETYIAFFAVLKIGAILMPLFSGFGPVPLATRLRDGDAKVVLTADGTLAARAGGADEGGARRGPDRHRPASATSSCCAASARRSTRRCSQAATTTGRR